MSLTDERENPLMQALPLMLPCHLHLCLLSGTQEVRVAAKAASERPEGAEEAAGSGLRLLLLLLRPEGEYEGTAGVRPAPPHQHHQLCWLLK